jgi:hypothetical protein
MALTVVMIAPAMPRGLRVTCATKRVTAANVVLIGLDSPLAVRHQA